MKKRGIGSRTKSVSLMPITMTAAQINGRRLATRNTGHDCFKKELPDIGRCTKIHASEIHLGGMVCPFVRVDRLGVSVTRGAHKACLVTRDFLHLKPNERLDGFSPAR